jgi:DNA-binding NarL/FixJ family response regulator
MSTEHAITIRNTNVRVTDVMEMIARGYSYECIMKEYPDLTMSEIMASARTAAELLSKCVTVDDPIKIDSEIKIIAHNGKLQTLTELRKKYPRAYEKWTEDEEKQVVSLYRSGKRIGEIAELLQRQRGAIRGRLEKLDEIEGYNYPGSGNHKQP